MEEQKKYDIPDMCDEAADKTPRTPTAAEAVSVPSSEEGVCASDPPATPDNSEQGPQPPAEPSECRAEQGAVRPNTKYCWRYSEQAEHDRRTRGGSGVRTYAIIMTLAFVVCLVALLGVVMIENGTFAPDIVRTIFVREYDSESGVLTVPEIAEKVKPSVVAIEVVKTYEGTEGVGIGTGIILSEDGYIATNYHVAEGGTAYNVVLSDKREFPATYVGGDELSDLALLKIEAKGLIPAELGNSDELVVGELAVAIGTPDSVDLAGTTTDGIISAISRDVKIYDSTGVMVKRMTLIQTNAAVNPGNSGGPLVNDRGQVVGIVSMRLGGTYTGIGFAIPINGAKVILDDIKVNGSVTDSSGVASKRAVIGITAGGIAAGDQYVLGDTTMTADIDGVIITEVTPGFDAANKLAVGDIMVEVDGVKVRTVYDVMAVVNEKNGGDSVTVKFYRDGSYYTVVVTLGIEE